MICRVVSCRVVSCRVVSYRIVSYRIVSYILYYNMKPQNDVGGHLMLQSLEFAGFLGELHRTVQQIELFLELQIFSAKLHQVRSLVPSQNKVLTETLLPTPDSAISLSHCRHCQQTGRPYTLLMRYNDGFIYAIFTIFKTGMQLAAGVPFCFAKCLCLWPFVRPTIITDCSFRSASPHLWNELPDSFCQLHQSCLDSPPHSLVKRSLLSLWTCYGAL